MNEIKIIKAMSYIDYDDDEYIVAVEYEKGGAVKKKYCIGEIEIDYPGGDAADRLNDYIESLGVEVPELVSSEEDQSREFYEFFTLDDSWSELKTTVSFDF